jgi:membrane protein
MGARMEVQDAGQRVTQETPPLLRRLIARAGDDHVATLAAGLAFFGLISVAPALGMGIAALRLATSPQTADRLVDLVSAFSSTLALGELLQQMEGKAASYAGVSLVLLLWPATTLASGWTRALDAVHELDSTPGVRGLMGRLKGLLLGLGLLLGVLALFGAVALGAGYAGKRTLAFVLVVVISVALAFVTAVCLYRWFPSTEPRAPLARLWRGAAWATAGLALVTVGLAVLLTVAEGFAQKYPPSLATAVIIGLWLYAGNLCLLLGAEYNVARHRQ